jgi:CheY-like chemotaxis protein
LARILVIDDDSSTLVTFSRMLQREGHRVTTAGSGRDGLALIQQAAFDLTIADYRLPDISGLEVLRRARASNNQTSFVIITAYGSIGLCREALRNGAADFVEKPIWDNDLKQVVDELLAGEKVITRHRRSHIDAGGQSVLPRIGPAARRWAIIVADVVKCEEDVPTIAAWSHKTPYSYGTIKTWCSNARVTAGDSLDFARLYRAVKRHEGQDWDLVNVFDVVDPRTLTHLTERAGLDERFVTRAPALSMFLRTQRLVTSPALLAALSEILDDAEV